MYDGRLEVAISVCMFMCPLPMKFILRPLVPTPLIGSPPLRWLLSPSLGVFRIRRYGLHAFLTVIVPNETPSDSDALWIGHVLDGTRCGSGWESSKTMSFPAGTLQALKTRRCSGSVSESLTNKYVFRIAQGEP